MTSEDSQTRSDRTPGWLTQRDLDLLCIGVGPICIHCHERLPEPEDPDRVCPTVSDTERVHEVARKLHDERKNNPWTLVDGIPQLEQAYTPLRDFERIKENSERFFELKAGQPREANNDE